ncbi:MAG: HlyD family secretion protein [Pseudodesulfovibrio sp.]|nr:HlyD family secretion protein [Pseudodesulfovibrio sp.]
MKAFFLKKQTTWIVVLLIALLPLPTIFNYMQRFVVRNGVVTAFRYDVKAPIDGVVGNLTAEPGTIPGEKPALRLSNKRNMGRYTTLEKELVSLEESLSQSQSSLAEYLDRIIRDLEQSVAILEARHIGERAALKESGQRRKRTLQLVEATVATEEDADRVETGYRQDEAQVQTTSLEIKQLKHRIRMLAQGMFPSDLSDSVIQVQERINTLQLDIFACKRRMSEAETGFSVQATPSPLPEGGMNNRSSKATVLLPETSVVWEVDVQDGMEVAKGDRLLSYIDRSQLMVMVAVDDATLELISHDHPVRIRLFGRKGFIDGKVSRVMGSAGIWHSNHFAAAIMKKSFRDGRVLVRIEDDQLYDEVEKFCGVGRAVYAEFEGIGLLEQYFGVFLR